MDSNVFVIIINPNDSTYNDTMNSANQIKARGAKIIGISDKKAMSMIIGLRFLQLMNRYIQ